MSSSQQTAGPSRPASEAASGNARVVFADPHAAAAGPVEGEVTRVRKLKGFWGWLLIIATAVTIFLCINQQFTLRRVGYAGNDPHDHQLVARHSGKCVDVSTVSTAPRAPIHQWTCNPANQASPLNQTWRLPGLWDTRE